MPVAVSKKKKCSKTILVIHYCFIIFLANQALLDLQQMHQDAEQRHVKTFDFHSNLERNAFNKGYLVSDNRGEGDCMFLALSEQLNFVKRIQLSAEELRQAVVQYLHQNPKLVNKLCIVTLKMKFTIQAQKYSQNYIILFFCLLYLCLHGGSVFKWLECQI